MKHKYITNYKNILIFTLMCISLTLFISNPTKYVTASANGMNVWALRLVPTLLPFMIVSRVIISTGVPDILGRKISPITNKLYRVPGASGYIYLLSILSGYPMGAKLTYDMFSQGVISKAEAQRISTFTSTSGPVFVIATVGAGMFGSTKIGVYVLLAHAIGSLLNGLLYSRHKIEACSMNVKPDNNTFGEIVIDSIQSILIIGVYINLFFILITMVNSLPFVQYFISYLSKNLHINAHIISSLFNGSIEITHGCLDLSACNLGTKANIVILSTIISFGGLSTLFQSYIFLKPCGISFKFLLKSKLTQTILTILVALALTLVI